MKAGEMKEHGGNLDGLIGKRMVREGYYSECARDVSYSLVLSDLNYWQSEVMRVIRVYGPIGSEDISRRLNITINRVTPRVKELREKEYVVFAGYGKSVHGRQISLWKINSSGFLNQDDSSQLGLDFQD